MNALTGRTNSDPSDLLREEILDPQFRYELNHLLPSYVAIERVLAAEYARMGLIERDDAKRIVGILQSASKAELEKLRSATMSDVAFTLERFIEQRLPGPVPHWHADRSRNDLQACAQLMFGKAQLVSVGETLLTLGESAHSLAESSVDVLMPGYTHFQAAQIISPGYYFAAISEHVLHSAGRLLATYDAMDACPLGSGAMAGQQLAWDRERLARLLGFQRVQRLALTGVASRAWVAETTAELGLLGTALSRFCTDLLMWSGSQYGFFDLPDEFSGISSAMPQKKNFPVLERIRGMTAHLSALHVDAILGQRNTPYTNLVEVSKEAGANLLLAFTVSRRILRLLSAVLDRLVIRADRMFSACQEEFFGGLDLANRLTLDEEVSWRRAQVIVGAYIVAAMNSSKAPSEWDAGLLRRIAEEHGFTLRDPERALRWAFDVGESHAHMMSDGSTRPEAVRAVLALQAVEYRRLSDEWERRAGFIDATRLDGLLEL